MLRFPALRYDIPDSIPGRITWRPDLSPIYIRGAGIALLGGLLSCALPVPKPEPEPAAAGPLSVGDTPATARTPQGEYISWKEHLIDDERLSGGIRLRGGDGLQMADLDQDGIEDIVSVHEDSNHIRIAFGSGYPDRWELVTLSSGGEAMAAEDVSIADANGDGWLDIVVA
jgi:hypothetical protein